MLNYAQSLEYLKSLETYGIKLGLDQVSELLDSFGNPQTKMKFIHVAGTNGKGSVCAMLYAALRNLGFKTAFYSSPHLVSPRERFRINGLGISEKEFSEAVSRLKPFAEKMKEAGRCPTYFEFTTVMAILFFSECNTDFVVWETGMGGRFDATNIVVPECSVISSIGIDHVSFLGASEKEIAFEKAGIIKHGIPVFCSLMSDDAKKTIKEVAEEKVAPISFLKDYCKDVDKLLLDPSIEDKAAFAKVTCPDGNLITLPLAGRKQVQNLLLSMNVLEYLCKKYHFDFEKSVAGIENTSWPARFQILPDGKILDGGHNVQAIECLVDSLKIYFPGKKFTVIYSALADKDVKSILPVLAGIAAGFIFAPVSASRKSYSEKELKNIAEELMCQGIELETAKSAIDALGMANGRPTLICGSLYLAGEILKQYFCEDEIINI